MVTCHWLSPGDEAIVSDPVDFLFTQRMRLAGGVPVPLRIDRVAPVDLEALEARVNEHTRLLCLCTPHNPLGRCFRRDELEAIGRFIPERGIRGLSDEIWSEVVYARPPSPAGCPWSRSWPATARCCMASPSPSAWPAFLRHLHARRDWAVTRLREIPTLAFHAPDATYVLFVGLPPMVESAEARADRLRRNHGVAVVP
jgi:aspartate/methionine/tyrosine aminotransferase